MWYTLADSAKQYPLTLERVKEIQIENKAGKKVQNLKAIELDTKEKSELELEFVDVVGQITLKSLDRKKEVPRPKPKKNLPPAKRIEPLGLDKKPEGQRMQPPNNPDNKPVTGSASSPNRPNFKPKGAWHKTGPPQKPNIQNQSPPPNSDPNS